MGRPKIITIEIVKQRLLTNRYIDKNECWNWTGRTYPSGYGVTYLNFKNKGVHRLSAHIFSNFDLNSKKSILHKCNNRKCFNPRHLYIGTQADNCRDRDLAGRQYCGERHHYAKLTKIKILKAKRLFEIGIVQQEIAKKLGISYPTINKVLRGKTWKHISLVPIPTKTYKKRKK